MDTKILEPPLSLVWDADRDKHHEFFGEDPAHNRALAVWMRLDAQRTAGIALSREQKVEWFDALEMLSNGERAGEKEMLADTSLTPAEYRFLYSLRAMDFYPKAYR